MLSESEKNEETNNIEDLFDLFFNRNPNNVPDDTRVFISDEETITFGELPNLIRKCAYNLQKQFGIQKGDVVAIRSLPHINYPLVMHGVIYAGGIIALVRQAPGDILDLVFQEIEVVKPKLFIFGSEGGDISLEAALKAGVPSSNMLVLDSNNMDGLRSVKDVLLSGNNLASPCTYTPEEFENHPSIIYFTSGSTGKKKAAQVTNKAMVYCVTHFSTTKRSPDRLLGNKPFCYGSTTFDCLISSIFSGDEVYISQVEDIHDICQALEKYKITTYAFLPHIISKMIKEEVYKKYDFSFLNRLTVGGSFIAQHAIEKTRQCFGIPVLNLYGASELLNPFRATPELTSQGAIGRLSPGYITRLVDGDGNDVEPGQPGELLIKGPTVTKGYYNNPEATAKAFTKDGFYRSDDVFIHDGDGVYRFISRLSHRMNYHTTNIVPHDIEKVVLTHPKVADCGVIGVFSNEESTDFPRAYVILVDKRDYLNKAEVARDILEYTNKQLSEMKQIRAGVIIKEALPRTVSGKIMYSVLKAEAALEQN